MFIRGLPGSMKKDVGRRLNNCNEINKITGAIKMQTTKERTKSEQASV